MGGTLLEIEMLIEGDWNTSKLGTDVSEIELVRDCVFEIDTVCVIRFVALDDRVAYCEDVVETEDDAENDADGETEDVNEYPTEVDAL